MGSVVSIEKFLTKPKENISLNELKEDFYNTIYKKLQKQNKTLAEQIKILIDKANSVEEVINILICSMGPLTHWQYLNKVDNKVGINL